MTTSIIPTSPTADAQLASFEAAAETFVLMQTSPNTRAVYKNALRRLAGFLAERGVNPWAATLADLVAFRDALTAAGLKGSSVAVVLSPSCSFFRFAFDQGVIERNPAAGLKRPSNSNETTRGIVSVRDAEALLSLPDRESIVGRRDRAMLALLLINGARTVELVRADVGDIVKIDGYNVLRLLGKSDKRRDAKLRPDVLAVVREYLKARGNPSADAPLFVGHNGRAADRMNTRTIRARVEHYLDRAGLAGDGISAHSFRHSAITHTIDAGAKLEQAQAMAGHSDPRTTARYFHNLNRLKNAAEDLNPISVR